MGESQREKVKPELAILHAIDVCRFWTFSHFSLYLEWFAPLLYFYEGATLGFVATL